MSHTAVHCFTSAVRDNVSKELCQKHILLTLDAQNQIWNWSGWKQRSLNKRRSNAVEKEIMYFLKTITQCCSLQRCLLHQMTLKF